MLSKHQSFKKLQLLAKNPLDLTKEGVLSATRVEEMNISKASLKMIYATERVDGNVISELCNLAKDSDVFTKLKDMQDMKVVNYVNNAASENRMVGHTAIRAESVGPDDSKETIEANKNEKIEQEKLSKFLEANKQFKHMIVCGIGGSFLGACAIAKALKGLHKCDKTLDFASNIDPDKIATILENVDIKKTVVAVISKSGNTMEIMSQQKVLEKEFEKAGLCVKEHFIMVTGKDSPMDSPVRYREIFYMRDYIGGRYSVTSMVGAVPIAFITGMETWKEFLKGASDMDRHSLEERNIEKNLPLMGALLGIWNRNFLNLETFAVIPYSSSLDLWGSHIQQLFMESNGKSVAKEDGSFIDFGTCPIVFGTCGTEGQHSYFQAIHQGTVHVPIEYIGFHHSQKNTDSVIDGTTNQEKLLANLFAQSISLARGKKSENTNQNFPGNRPSRILMAEYLSAYSMGALLSYYESVAVFQGFIWGINSFDQEGVQLGKVNANNIVEEYKNFEQTHKFSENENLEVEVAFMKQINSLSDSS